TGGTQNVSQITLVPGDNATCTINNNDNAPSLTLLKTERKNDGDAATSDKWTLTATGTGTSPTNLSGKTPLASGAGFKADTYTLSESGGPSGYTGSWSCNGGTLNGNEITLALGQSATCTINNNDNAPSLTLLK